MQHPILSFLFSYTSNLALCFFHFIKKFNIQVPCIVFLIEIQQYLIFIIHLSKSDYSIFRNFIGKFKIKIIQRFYFNRPTLHRILYPQNVPLIKINSMLFQ